MPDSADAPEAIILLHKQDDIFSGIELPLLKQQVDNAVCADTPEYILNRVALSS